MPPRTRLVNNATLRARMNRRRAALDNQHTVSASPTTGKARNTKANARRPPVAANLPPGYDSIAHLLAATALLRHLRRHVAASRIASTWRARRR